jgi:hypothetical protein
MLTLSRDPSVPLASSVYLRRWVDKLHRDGLRHRGTHPVYKLTIATTG